MKMRFPANPLQDSLTLILAGGRGERLFPLTRDRTKGAIPFGGMYHTGMTLPAGNVREVVMRHPEGLEPTGETDKSYRERVNAAITGKTDAGTFAIGLHQLKQIRFHPADEDEEQEDQPAGEKL